VNRHAVVIGGGIGGLLAAHALAGRFDRVTVLERDRYPVDSGSGVPPARRGAPQSRCLHLLTGAGAATFDELAPGWTDDLVALGAVPFDASADAALHVPAGWLPRAPSAIATYACSRALVEEALRRGLAAKSSVCIREGRKALGLHGSLDGRVTGVRTAGASGEATLPADLVVDASGRGSILPEWIESLHGGTRPRPEETVVEPAMRYVSRWFRLEPEDAPDWHCVSIAPAAGTQRRAAMMLRAEHGRWGVVLLAPASQPLPSDDRAFLNFTANLGDGKLFEALTRAQPASPIHRYGATSNRMRRYERLRAWPAGLVALGDSVCALDPYFGLGMTLAAKGVALLARRLDEDRGEIASLEFQHDLAAMNAEPWRIATGRDLDGQLQDKHESRLSDAAPSSPEAAHALLRAQDLLRPAESLTEFDLA
jgi:2-polyprenyl-6-methoxyphenol hydroxylase-like FAD-dependent oxidoreductase